MGYSLRHDMANPGVGQAQQIAWVMDDMHGNCSFGLGIKKAPVWGLNG